MDEKQSDAADIIIPETKKFKPEGARITDKKGRRICDVGEVPFEPLANGETDEYEVELKLKPDGTAEIKVQEKTG